MQQPQSTLACCAELAENRLGRDTGFEPSMVSKDCSEIELPGEIVKNDDPLTLPLAGPLEEIANLLKKMRKAFPKPTDPVFSFKNFRWTWDKVCCQLGLGAFDEKTKKVHGSCAS